MKIVTQFELKDKTNREQTDLRNYEREIKAAIYKILESTIPVTVFEKYYEIVQDISSAQARLIGRKISYDCSELRKLRKSYYSGGRNISNQIFRRKKVNHDKKK